MPRRAPILKPIDPTPAVMTADQLVANGVAKAAEACAMLGCGETKLAEYVKAKAFPTWKEGRDRVFPRSGILAYLAQRAREEGVAT